MAETKFKVGKIVKTHLDVAVGDRSTTFMFPPKKGNYFKIRNKLSEEGLHIPSIRELSDLLYCAINHENSGRDKLDLSGLVLEHFQSGIQSSVYFLYSQKRILGGDRAEVVYLLQDFGLDYLPDERELEMLVNKGEALCIPIPVERYAEDKHPLWKALLGEEMLEKLVTSPHFRIYPDFRSLFGKIDRGFLRISLSKEYDNQMGMRYLSLTSFGEHYIFGMTNSVSNKFDEISSSEYRSYRNAVTRARKEKEHRDSLPSHDDYSNMGYTPLPSRSKYGLNPDD